MNALNIPFILPDRLNRVVFQDRTRQIPGKTPFFNEPVKKNKFDSESFQKNNFRYFSFFTVNFFDIFSEIKSYLILSLMILNFFIL